MEKELVRSVARAFYETEHIVVVDALVKHSACTLDDLRHIFLTMRHNKEILKYIGRLTEQGLVTSYTRQETKPGAQKSTAVQYFYIDYRRAIDVVKYRVHKLQEKLAHHGKPTTEKKEFACPRCKAEWTQSEVIDNADPAGRGSGFLCNRCQGLLNLIPHSKDDELDGDNPLGVFNKQFHWLIKILQQIDNTEIPAVTFESALEARVHVPKPKAPLDSSKTTAEETTTARPTAVMGIKSGPEKVQITLSTDLETNAAAHQAEVERKARIATQNELPSWHTQSTVAASTTTAQKPAVDDKSQIDTSTNNTIDQLTADDEEDLDQFYKEMAEHHRLAEMERQKEEKSSSDGEDGDDDDDDADEFEDVDVLPPTAKKARMEDGSAASTPLASFKNDTATDSNAGTPVNGNGTSTPAGGAQAEESDEDDEEFEEVV